MTMISPITFQSGETDFNWTHQMENGLQKFFGRQKCQWETPQQAPLNCPTALNLTGATPVLSGRMIRGILQYLVIFNVLVFSAVNI